MAKQNKPQGDPKPTDEPKPKDKPKGDPKPKDEPKPRQERKLPDGTFELRLKQAATLGAGPRRRGEVLGMFRCGKDVTPDDVLAAVRDPRWTQEVVTPEGDCEVLVKRAAAGRRVGDVLFAVRPAAGYRIRECINALRNPELIGL